MSGPFARSLRIHGAMLRDALRPGQPMAPLHLRRAAMLAAGLPPYLAVQASHWLGFGLDALCFRDAHKESLQAPLFVLGIPRS
ncbi:MAG: hypothetical protein ACX94A_04245, partial [Algiphilus sp.]